MNPRFQPLQEALAERRTSVVRLTFGQIETILGTTLPDPEQGCADAWWEYRDLGRAATGSRAGWQSKVDFRRREVTFAAV